MTERELIALLDACCEWTTLQYARHGERYNSIVFLRNIHKYL